MPGLVVRVLAAAGEEVAAGQKLFTLEAMKMETTLVAEKGRAGRGGCWCIRARRWRRGICCCALRDNVDVCMV